MLFSIAGMTGLALVLYLTGLVVFLTPLPIAFSYYRRGPLPAAASMGLGLLVLLLLYRVPPAFLSFLPLAPLYPPLSVPQLTALSLLSFFYYTWMGLTMGVLAKRSFTIEKSYLLFLMLNLLAPLALLLALSKGLGLHPISDLQGGLNGLLNHLVEAQGPAVSGQDDQAAFLKKYGPALVDQTMTLVPALLVNATLMIVSLNALFLRRWCLLSRPFSAWPDFSHWALRDKWIWAPIILGGLYFLNLYLLEQPLLGAVLVNGLLVLAALYFFQGLAILSFITRQRLSPLMRIMVYMAVLLFLQLVGIVIVLLGLFDFWFDFRKLKRVA